MRPSTFGRKSSADHREITRRPKSPIPHVPTVLAYRGVVYTVRDGGILSCYDAESGTPHYRVRVPGAGNYYASPVAANDHVYFASKNGIVSVIRSGPKHEVVSKNNLDAEIMATPAILDDTLYIASKKRRSHSECPDACQKKNKNAHYDCDGNRNSERLPTIERLTQRQAELEANGIDEAELKPNSGESGYTTTKDA